MARYDEGSAMDETTATGQNGRPREIPRILNSLIVNGLFGYPHRGFHDVVAAEILASGA